MKKVAIIGRGTAGAISALNAASQLKPKSLGRKYAIDWYYDSSIPTQAVGEGTGLLIPTLLAQFGFLFSDFHKLGGYYKNGVSKRNWSKGNYFIHPFTPPNLAVHINALKLQDFATNALSNQKNIRLIDKNITSKEIDADLIIDCSGRPKQFDSKFIFNDYIPINSVHVTQCYWDYPRFDYSISDATKNGWVFGIPLQERCSVGYLYNSNFCTLDEAKEDVKSVFDYYNLTPSENTNSFSFKSYRRKKNIEDNVCHNGNNSFFIEPLEATSLIMCSAMARLGLLALESNFSKNALDAAEKTYRREVNSITCMIMLHYFSGSIFKNKFWNYAEERGKQCIIDTFNSDNVFRKYIEFCFLAMDDEDITFENVLGLYDSINKSDKYKKYWGSATSGQVGYGSWSPVNWLYNILGLQCENELRDLIKNILK